MKDIRIS